MPENYLKSAIHENKFFHSAELVLGRDHAVADAETFVTEAAQSPDGVRIISLTDLPGGNPALPPEAFASFILEHGLTPLAHLTGKDGNRSLLEGRLHHLAKMGIENVLALTGDAQNAGFMGKAKPVYDLDSVLILELIRIMQSGIQYSLGARALRSTPFDFFAGAVVSPYKTHEPDQMMQFYKLHLKAALGAKFVITQLGFNLRKLYELKQYLIREGLGALPLVANVYIPTATIAKMMKSGEPSGCVVTDELIRRLEQEKKPQRLERAALMVAAVKDLGFSGAHIGGFGLTHKDFLTVMGRASEIGNDWKKKIDELIFEMPGDFYLFSRSGDGLSDGASPYNAPSGQHRASMKYTVSRLFHHYVIRPESSLAKFFASRLHLKGIDPRKDGSWRRGFWYKALELSSYYRIAALQCQRCGDCIQEHLNYAGCTMRWCYKNLRNGPCGGSRVDGTCEADAGQSCIWNIIYSDTLAAGEDPSKFGRVLIPPRDWSLDRMNALANRFANIDNYETRSVRTPTSETNNNSDA
jgi:methylenetetrahydrofolate reductase (NADPH)